MTLRPMRDPRLDTELADALDRLAADGWLPIVTGDVDADRSRYHELALLRRGAGVQEVGEVHDDLVPAGADGADVDVPVRVYRPSGALAGVTVVWLHGGGWVLGDLDTADASARRVCEHLRATVVSVDYRLAPEHPHPAPLSDCLAALRWAAARAGDDRVVVGGDSAGGGLAAGCALLARDWGPRLDAQLLLYPGLDPAMGRPSVTENAEGPFLTRGDMQWFYGHYLPEPGLRADPSVALAAADELDDLAPAVVAVAELDPLRDEGLAHAAALTAAGVDVRLLHGQGLVHGWFGLAAASTAARREGDRALDAVAELLVRTR